MQVSQPSTYVLQSQQLPGYGLQGYQNQYLQAMPSSTASHSSSVQTTIPSSSTQTTNSFSSIGSNSYSSDPFSNLFDSSNTPNSNVFAQQQQMQFPPSQPSYPSFGDLMMPANNTTQSVNYAPVSLDLLGVVNNVPSNLPTSLFTITPTTSQPNFPFGPSPTPTDKRSKLAPLINLQAFDGSFQLSNALAGALGVDISTLTSFANSLNYAKGVVATALAIAFFEVYLASFKEEWELVTEKSRRWLKSSGIAVDAIVDKSKQFLLANVKNM